jgi:hypothetical protein
VYDQQTTYGFQGEISSEVDNNEVMISIAKEDLRFAQGSDTSNRQGIYLLEQVGENKFVRVASTGEFARQEVTLEARLNRGRKYCFAGGDFFV